MTPSEAVKNLRVLTQGVTENADRELLWRTLREVKNTLDRVKDAPTVPTMGLPRIAR